MPQFVPAQELSAGFYNDLVAPVLGGIGHAAGLLGWGSDVLGYDTERSMDHDWGPRLVVLVDEPAAVLKAIEAVLPDVYRGFPVRFGSSVHAVEHRVTVARLSDWLRGQLGFDASQGIGVDDWLVTPQQQFLGVVKGQVYADDGRLAPVRAAFARLGHPDGLDRALAGTVAAGNFADRERALVTAYRLVAARHNALGITPGLDPEPRPFFDRPALVLDAGRFAGACHATVSDPRLKRIGPIGSIDQFVDSTDVLSNPSAYRRLVEVFQ